MNPLANSITILSLACGFFSIIFSLEGLFGLASWAIILSVVFDGIDGQIARRKPSSSEFGRELDSLADVISFGVAPSILGYSFLYREFYPWSTAALFFYLFASVIRLAKYNVTPKDKLRNFFFGLPTTVSGGMLAAFILIYRNNTDAALAQYVPTAFIFLVLALALLMTSRIKYLNLDGLGQALSRRRPLIIVLLAALLIAAGLVGKQGAAMFGIFLIYLVFSPLLEKGIRTR
jgi:CDP-diacylglycerol--serine O-phosphatidyltransferase